ncbi:hypothetical protein [Actinopolymorpha pittospori]
MPKRGGRNNRRNNQGNPRSRIGKKVEEEIEEVIDDLTHRGRGRRRRGDDDDPNRSRQDDEQRKALERKVDERLNAFDEETRDKSARDAILARGGGGGQVKQLGHYADMSVRELAELAETGSAEEKRWAEKALKIIKRAEHYRDKQRGSG